MTFVNYIKNNHPDPDTLLGKPVLEGMDELLTMHIKWLIDQIESAKIKPEYEFIWDLSASIEIIKQS